MQAITSTVAFDRKDCLLMLSVTVKFLVRNGFRHDAD